MARVTSTKTRDQHKRSMIICIVIGAFFILLAGIYTAINWSYMVMGETKDLNTAIYNGEQPQKGDNVTLKVSLVLGNYAETKHKRYFITTGTDQHYAVVVPTQESVLIMSVKLKDESDIEVLDSLIEPTWNLLAGKTDEYPAKSIEFKGRISAMDSQISGFYQEALSGAGIDASSGADICSLTLDATETRASEFLITAAILAIAVLCFIGAIASRSQMKKLGQIQDIARENAADPALNPFLTGSAAPQNPYSQPEAATQNPYVQQEAASQNPYVQQEAASQNPYAQQEAAPQNPYVQQEAATQNPYVQQEAAPQAPYVQPDAAPQEPYVQPDSSIPDSYPDISINDYDQP